MSSIFFRQLVYPLAADPVGFSYVLQRAPTGSRRPKGLAEGGLVLLTQRRGPAILIRQLEPIGKVPCNGVPPQQPPILFGGLADIPLFNPRYDPLGHRLVG